MKECGVIPSDPDRIAEAENKRLTSKEPNPFHKFPEHSAKRGEKRRRRRRSKGSEKKSSTNSSENNTLEKKKRGRPKGSKNAPKGKDLLNRFL